jgi:hypothetical protein
MLANCGFAAVFAAPGLAGLRHLGHNTAKGQSNGSPKNGHSEANCLAIAGCQKLGDVAAKLLRTQTAFREGLSPLAAAIAISSQATVLAYQ